MPTYDYKCEECGTVVEIIHGIKEDTLTEIDCPSCKKKQKCRRLISKNYFDPIFNWGIYVV